MPPQDSNQNEDTTTHILIVDDEEIIRDLTSEMLNSVGYSVLTAANGQEAIDVYLNSQVPIKLVITDVKMPVMDGITAIEKLKEINPNLKFMVVSGLLEEDKIKRLEHLQVDKIIEKPFVAEAYLESVAQLL